jgi:hypothetical protein
VPVTPRGSNMAAQNNAIPLRSRNVSNTASSSGAIPRKVFNCFVDDTVLVAGVRSSQLKRWVSRGDVHMFVPLQCKYIVYFDKMVLTCHSSGVSPNGTQV